MKTLQYMINVKQHPFRILVLLQLTLCFLLLGGRMMSSMESWYGFLLWNLFLGLIPLYTARYLFLKHQKTTMVSLGLLALTVVFLPNAPYLITDLIHLHPHTNIPLWYDGLLLFTFAVTGLSWGVYALRYLHKWLALRLPDFYTWSLLIAMQLASGYGIYLGRVHRLNSWDIIHHPMKVIYMITYSFLKKECIVMSLSFGGLLIIIYLLLHIAVQYLKQQHYAVSEKNME